MITGVKCVFYRTLYSQSAASLTMGRVGAVLRHEGHEVDMCLLRRDQFCHNELDSVQRLLLDSESYPVVIAKPNFKDAGCMLPLLKQAKSEGRFTHVFLCGPFASCNACDIMEKHPWVDGIIYGAPEDATRKIVNSLRDDGSFDTRYRGGLWRSRQSGKLEEGGEIRERTPFPSLPWPARDVERAEGVGYANIEASRGCGFNCSFCHMPVYQGSRTSHFKERRPARDVVDEMQELHEKLGKHLFIFNDSHFWAGKDDDAWVREFCDEIISRNLSIHFYIYLRCSPFPPDELISRMSDAGLARVFLGIENASDAILEKYNKGAKSQDEFFAVKERLESRHINIHIGFITFCPYSSLEDIKQNIEYLYSIPKLFRFGLILEPMRVIPGSAMHRSLIEDGLMDKNLSYESITWGYRYAESRVKELYDRIYAFLEDSMPGVHYRIEYFCVSGRLLRDMYLKNHDASSRLNEVFSAHERLCGEVNETAYRVLSVLVDAVSKGEDASGMLEGKRKEFLRLEQELEYQWGAVFEEVRRAGAGKLLSEVFEGVE